MKHNVFICHKNCIHIYNQTPLLERVHLMTNISASAACILQIVCPTTHCCCSQALLRLSVAAAVLWRILLCVSEFNCCCCVVVP